MLFLGAATPVFKLSVSCSPPEPLSFITHLYCQESILPYYSRYHAARSHLTSSRLPSQKMCLREHETFCHGSHSRDCFQPVVVEVGILQPQTTTSSVRRV